ncbi:TetR/AcrR family transcriptional regulator [Roseomonas stagni]|uniref:TetR/AcrR family transcriptional regulator n=1 Tax=Falsiroseomonas algicola TaxID=2716930 RepID=A0A6M1LSH5_9PROT|nr:TetR family transcriptional regulator [Falsiroseomonas algicola]NGM23418.1 TetR/AcrR family transcriptional regulator [Falsiroseomonas algicola]
MGRRPTIDREKVLDIVEAILLRDGTAGLTIDAVARAADISKGGVQSRFGTKNDLIAALLERGDREYLAQVTAAVGLSPGPVDAVRGNVAASLAMALANGGKARAAAFLAAMIEAREHLASVSTWYRDRFGGLDLESEEGRRARLALFATEGAFILDALGFFRLQEEEWRSLAADLDALIEGKL